MTSVIEEPEHLRAERDELRDLVHMPEASVVVDHPRRRTDDLPPAHPSWHPEAIGDVMRGLADGTLELPEPIIGVVEGSDLGLFYPRRVNSLVGKGGDGKTWIAGVVAKQEIDAGSQHLADRLRGQRHRCSRPPRRPRREP